MECFSIWRIPSFDPSFLLKSSTYTLPKVESIVLVNLPSISNRQTQNGRSIFHCVKKGLRDKIPSNSLDYEKTDYFLMMSISGKKIDGWIVKDEIKRNEVLSVYRSTGIWMVLIP